MVSASDVDTDNVQSPKNCQAKDPEHPMEIECDWKQGSGDDDNGDDDGLTDAEVNCDENYSSGLPTKIFTDGMYEKFCREDHGGGHAMVVNVYGSTKPSRHPWKRSPPVSQKSYRDARGVLEFTKKKNNNDQCKGTCAAAFKRLAQSQCKYLLTQILPFYILAHHRSRWPYWRRTVRNGKERRDRRGLRYIQVHGGLRT